MENNLKIITIGGMIGVGKTSLINNISKKLTNQGKKVKVVYELWEEKEDNIQDTRATHDDVMDMLLEMYYNNIGGLSSSDENTKLNSMYITVTHQIHFLSTRVSKVVLAIEKAKKLKLDYLLIDRTIFEDIIFTKINLFHDPLFWETYYTMWNLWEARLFKEMRDIPTRNIILTAPIETILERIKKRGRDLEQNAGLEEYFTNLNENYANDMINYFILKRIRNYEVIETNNKTIEELTNILIKD